MEKKTLRDYVSHIIFRDGDETKIIHPFHDFRTSVVYDDLNREIRFRILHIQFTTEKMRAYIFLKFYDEIQDKINDLRKVNEEE